MSESPPEAEFHSIFFTRLRDYIHREDSPFNSVRIEENNDRGRADIFVDSDLTGSLVIEIKKDSVYPLNSDVIKQARDYADATGVDYFATCNSNDFFLFHYSGQIEIAEIPYYYLNMRDVDLYDQSLNDRIPTILNAVQYLTNRGELPKQGERDRVVGLLRSFHTSIWPTFQALAREKYGTDPTFTDKFDEWVLENDYSSLDKSEQFALAAKQYAYLISNKILFYEVVREQTPDPVETESGFALDSLVDGISESGVDRHIEQQFQEIQDEIDYEPVFDEDSSLFADYPHNAKTRKAIVDLLGSIEAKKISQIDEDLLGELYEELIPESERRDLGQFYTHPDIAEAICNWAIEPDSEDIPRVLDPASGSGTFTVEAYHRIQQVNPTATHQEIVDNIVAVDINRFPLHLTALNLSSRNIQKKTRELHTFNDSFFTLSPQDKRIPRSDDDGDELGNFDAAVANPPYIRQENLYPNKEHFRSHLKDFAGNNSKLYYSGRKSLSKKSDAYIYFITHAIQFLRDGGRLGFIVPTKWLITKYGESFQEFLYDQTKIHAVVGFSDRAFTALVDTVLLFVERCEDEQERQESVVDFIRVKEQLSPEDLSSIAGYQRSVPDDKLFDIEVSDEYRTVSVPQRHLEEQGGQKLGYYLYGPSPFIPLVNSKKMVELEEFAEVSFGNKTGNNGFFLLDEQEVSQWDIDERFLKPAIRSIRDMESLTLTETDQYLLDFSEYVKGVEAQRSGLRSNSNLAEEVKKQLREDGYNSTLRYLEHGEDEGVPEGRTVSEQNTPWFNLGELLVPEVLHPVFYNERVFTVDNIGGFAPTNAIQCIDVTRYEDVIQYILNSTVYKIMLELWGRHEGGGALQLLTYEVSSVPVPNPELMSDSQRERIKDAGQRMVRGETDARAELDRVILEFLELDMSPEELQAAHRGMMSQRIEGAANENVMIKDIDDFDDYNLDSLIPDYDPDNDDSMNTNLSDF
ncbi:N-6 DNA methylase [Halomicroarcula sp. F13]|uniref:N-6 DNA methylase n=1 Tax=Haloarcula rubra TaxID=2487747 RepID=A0AAW4PVQ9_9EURY|nr:N-6 DNA methylase [Halomicroarcula rubra]MBX0325128.1 N-6 DNA methylase [Halomicroarcula rubra]